MQNLRTVNILTTGDKCSFVNRDNLTQHNQMQLSKKRKPFSEFFSAFLKTRLNFEHFHRKLTLIAYIFPELPIPKYVVR